VLQSHSLTSASEADASTDPSAQWHTQGTGKCLQVFLWGAEGKHYMSGKLGT
jgi:hypothetical protein